MENMDNFDLIGQYSTMELRQKLYKLKLNNMKNFLEISLSKSYILYKKNKNSEISFKDYKDQLLKELEKNKNRKSINKN